MGSGPLAARRVAARAGGMQGDQNPTVDGDVLDRPLYPILGALDLNIGEMELLVRIQQIGQPVGPKPDPAEDLVMVAVRDEANERRVRHGVRLEDLLGRGLENEVKAT